MNMPPTFLQILKMNVSVPSWSLKNEVYRLKKKKKDKLYFFLKPYLEGWVPKRIIEKNLKLQTIFILML